MKFDGEEVGRMARDLDALLAEVGGPDEVRELSVERFRHQLDGDDDAAERVLERIKAAGEHHAAAGELLRLFGQAVTCCNMALAVGSYAGIQALVRGARAGDAGEGEEG
ncbi:MAG: hypothetical protein M3R38_12475 [Actinomycetota bacterium]|jgi:hypothetical protein|nr:hypothetical protein [Actinomycetota bacterium]